ncbi:4Fe-4S dicluster domain-containing protein [Candidatus Woesearchaeota archaeon]|nr:4Fe-4S dicluster domain-containing protein [Candidatus Woesearchaeota archaeon]
MRRRDVVAPVKTDKSRFQRIENPDDIWLDENTDFPIKKFFFSNREVLFEFSGNKVKNPSLELKDTVYFGVRRCDLNGIMHQDMVFLDDNPDPFYKARRDNSILFGLHCKEGDEYCFCNSVGLKDFFDLMMYDKGNHYLIESGTEKGLVFLDEFKKFFEETAEMISDNDRKIKNNKKLSTTNIKYMYGNESWEDLAKTCLSCGACNLLCPNCHCFTIQDEIDFDLKSGRRVRVPAACQSKGFTRVAGDHIFRETRVSRFKHRIYHQIQYFKERHNEIFCTGCGRCIRGCPVRIDWVKKINEIKDGN